MGPWRNPLSPRTKKRTTHGRRTAVDIPAGRFRGRTPRTIFALIGAAAAALGVRALLPSGSAETPAAQPPAVVRSLAVRVHRELPHDTDAYTQGLLWWDGKLYESTGQYGRSDLRRLDPRTGAVEQRIDISPAYFGEGLARVGERLVMLTWKAERAFVFGLERFDEQRTLRYEGEGWGLCNDGRRLVMSNGSDRLTFRDPRTFDVLGEVAVTLRGFPLTRINELECVDGAVYANVYQTDFLVRIDPASGRVTHHVDASGLLTREEAHGVDVLNGIAFDPGAETFYVTGKLWPKMFEVTFED